MNIINPGRNRIAAGLPFLGGRLVADNPRIKKESNRIQSEHSERADDR